MSKILRDAGEGRVAEALAGEHAGIALQPAERELVKKLLAFPAVVEEAAERRAPHLLAVYALELAQVFTAYYRDCPILKVDDEGLKSFRLATTVATRRVVARALGLLGVSAPETM
jgi:arginyl-tRNA synthetase